MKTIIFVRHAKSSWDDLSLKDYDRPLNNRGKRDSIFMANKLKELNWNPEIVISSSAKRAVSIASTISKTLYIKNLVIEPNLYLAPPSVYMQIITNLDTKYNKVMMVGHNPTMTEIVNYFSEEFVHNVPTSGIFRVNFNTDTRKEVSFENGRLIDFIYPKLYI